MSANPALVLTYAQELVPAPFPGESFLLRRTGVQLDLDGVRTPSGKWSTRGSLFLSNIRLVFIADKADASGLAAFDLPLVYMKDDKLNQPIFGCNNLAGMVWPAVDGGGPAGTLPPHKFIVYFKEGGIGTFYPLYYTLTERAKQVFALNTGQHMARTAQVEPNPESYAQGLASKAFVDPSDPTKIYLSQPVDESQRLPDRPKYAANYGQDEVYEDMLPGHGAARQ
eukprot:CAMPEP_0202922856 /NCGR_PEP_ID=MMETSP1392-20130828/78143_1 /ASSEMBLY_ACC=CAM_ASM_000868 /TAXON_ID=225041 /ORGANISM="Chlamydomonas chlamydogama, Strain SAG 11-48b" /LENGTH=224 /DNA_ID=CAMNT_0049616509 /DNA_START=50 /DNA_END=724 /DNA_ORIENTATION=+